MTRIVAVLALLATVLPGCGPGINLDALDSSPAPAAPVRQVVVASPDLVAAVDDGIAWWGDAGRDSLVRVDACADGAPCTVVRWARADELANDVGGITSGGRALVRVNPEVQLGYLPPGALDVIVAHELGHVQGLGHVVESTELMDGTSPLEGRICISGEACREFGGGS